MDEAYKIDLDMLMSFSGDLLDSLKDMKEINTLGLCRKQFESLQSSCDSSYKETMSLIEDYQNKINACKQQTEKAKSEVIYDSEIKSLESDLADAEKRDRLLEEELRVISSDLSELELQRISIENQRKKLQKMEQAEKRAAAMLSFYASVTNIIPDLNQQSKISGNIVDKDKKAVRQFELDEGFAVARYSVECGRWGF